MRKTENGRHHINLYLNDQDNKFVRNIIKLMKIKALKNDEKISQSKIGVIAFKTLAYELDYIKEDINDVEKFYYENLEVIAKDLTKIRDDPSAYKNNMIYKNLLKDFTEIMEFRDDNVLAFKLIQASREEGSQIMQSYFSVLWQEKEDIDNSIQADNVEFSIKEDEKNG